MQKGNGRNICMFLKLLDHSILQKIQSIFLVGGFAANNWFFNNLKTTLASRGLDVCRPDNHTCVATVLRSSLALIESGKEIKQLQMGQLYTI